MKLISEINHSINLDSEWNQFKVHFEKVNPDFFENLQKEFPELSKSDLKVLAYIKINLSTKEIAQMLNISVSAVLYFNDKGQLINFVTNDRYYWNEDNTYSNVQWETPVGEYREINGMNLVSYAEALWVTENGREVYAKFNMLDVKVNPDL